MTSCDSAHGGQHTMIARSSKTVPITPRRSLRITVIDIFNSNGLDSLRTDDDASYIHTNYYEIQK